MRIVEYKRKANVERNMELIREVLLKVEGDPEMDGYHYKNFDSTDFPGYTDEQVAYHVEQLVEADLLKGGDGTMDRVGPPVCRLTWSGHEFLENIKDVGVWKQVKVRIAGLPGLALPIVAKIAEAEIMKRLGLNTF
jgi:hypothetical protein